MTDCPHRFVGDVGEVLSYAAMYEKGLPPVAGGVLDQAQWFVRACELIWADEAQLKPPSLVL